MRRELRTLRRVAAIGLLTAGLAGGPGAHSAGAAVPREFFSVQAWSTPSVSDAQRMGRGGIGTLRAVFDWGSIAPKGGTRHWDAYDVLVRRAAMANMRVLPVLMGSPYFGRRSAPPPRSRSRRRAFADFARDTVARYGRGGTFWRDHPDIPARPAVAFQIWNEPNFPVYWGGRPSPRQYVALLKDAHAAVRSRDPKATVVLAGLPETALGIPMANYLRGVYAVRGAKRAFDAVAIHPYARDYRGVFGAITRVRAVMRRAHDSRTSLWITETGWASGGPAGPRTQAFRTSERGQAKRLHATVTRLLRARRRYRIGLVSWFSWRDRGRRHGERDWWAIHTGLLRRNGRAKPAWRTYSRLALER
jgi:hypothetical protein